MLSLAATIRIVEDWFGKDRPSRRSWKELLWTSPTASDFTMRESPTLRLFDDNKFFPSRYLPLSTLLPVVLLRRPRKFFLSLLSSPLFNILFSLHTKRWYNVIWLFWVVILVWNGAWWSCKKIDGAPFYFGIGMSILRVNYATFWSFLFVWLWEEKREKGNYRWCPLIPAYYGVLAFLDTQTGIICSTRATWASSFFCPNEKFTEQLLLQQTKKFTWSIRDKGYMQRTPWPSVRIGHYMLDDLAAAGTGISRAVSDQTKQRWIGREK